MKRVLFTIQWHPSVYSANALCDQKIIDILSSDDDYDITCLAYRPFGALKEEKDRNVNTIRFVKSLWWNIKVDSRGKNTRIDGVVCLLDKMITRLFQVLTIPIFPITEPFAYLKFARKALEIQEKEHFDIVISEYHGLDSLHAGKAIKSKYNSTKYIAILWDSFTGKEPAKYLPKWYSDWKMEKAEERELGCADKIIVMESSRAYHENNSTHKTYYNKIQYLDIPGIVKPPVSSRKSNLIKQNKINVIYAGILSLPDRDPEYIIKAIASTRKANDINLIFLCTGSGKQKLRALSNEYPNITISGFVDKDELVSIYNDSDILLNFGGPNPNMVPSKVFEYLSYGKPIISTYYIDNEASLKYLEKYPYSLCIDQRLPINNAIKKLDVFLDEILGKRLPFENIKETYKNNTPEMFKKMIDEL